MNKSEILKELNMNYNDLCEYLLKKYGKAKYDYFCKSNCKSRNRKNSRTKEGLFCHHIDEDKACNLSDTNFALLYPFSYQKADRLVYCNYLEHLIFHMKIGINNYWEDHTELKMPKEFSYFIRPGVKWISEEVNELFDKNGSEIEWQNRCFEEIKNNFEDYIYILRTFVQYIDDNYVGKREKHIIEVGKHINHPELGNGIITNIDSFGRITIEFKNKKVTLQDSGDYQEQIEKVRKALSTDREQKTIMLIYERMV